MEKYAGTQVLSRTFGLIRLFTDDKPVWRLSDLIEVSGLKRTTVFRLLSALEGEGIVHKNDQGEYMLGSELIAWGGRAMRANHLRACAKPFMTNLVRQSNESVTLDLLWRDDNGLPMSMVVEEELGRHVMGMAQYIGGRFPAHATSTGHVLLAWQTERYLEEIDFTLLLEAHPTSIKNRSELLSILKTTQKEGYGMTQDELEIGLSAVAAPIFNTHAEIQGALCIAAPSSRMGNDRIAELAQMIMPVAGMISTRIGYEGKNNK